MVGIKKPDTLGESGIIYEVTELSHLQATFLLLRRSDSNRRPLGYEPSKLTNCSTAQRNTTNIFQLHQIKPHYFSRGGIGTFPFFFLIPLALK